MRIGVSSYWFNRGQAVVGRHLRSALDDLGHETFVLARPSKDSAAKPALIERRFVWEQFEPGHVEGAKRAFDVVYSVLACERERYASLGIESPRVRWGCHPE